MSPIVTQDETNGEVDYFLLPDQDQRLIRQLRSAVCDARENIATLRENCEER